MRRLIFALAMVVAGCASQTPYEQKIEGVVLRGEKVIQDVKVRFLTDYPEGNCNAQGLEAATDREGKFVFSQLYTPVVTEKYAVLVHPYRLCVFFDEQWQIAWKLTTGPAPASITFRCNLDDNGSVRCLAQ